MMQVKSLFLQDSIIVYLFVFVVLMSANAVLISDNKTKSRHFSHVTLRTLQLN